MSGCESGGAGVGGHRRRRVAGGDARHALHAQAHGLRDAARHAVVLERAGGIEALVLEDEVGRVRRMRAAAGPASSGVLPSRSVTTES